MFSTCPSRSYDWPSFCERVDDCELHWWFDPPDCWINIWPIPNLPMPHCATWFFNIFETTRLSQLNFVCSVAQCERLHGSSSWDWQLDVGQFGRQGLCEGNWDWSLHPKGQGSLQRLSCLRPGTQWAWYLPNGSYSWRNIAIHSPEHWPTMKPAFPCLFSGLVSICYLVSFASCLTLEPWKRA